MSRENKVKIFKIFLAIIVLSLFLGIIIYLFPIMKDLSTLEGQITFKEKVENSGILGLLSLFGLQVAQIFLIIVPGEPIEILAGMCYGSLWGTVFIMLSACIISTTIFLLVRKFGRKIVGIFIILYIAIFINPDLKQKLNNLTLTYLPYFVFVMYLLNSGTTMTQAIFMN